MRWVWHVECRGKMKNAYWALVGKSEGNRPFEDTGEEGNITLYWILKK
jgi:hypothetical protein